MKSIRGEGKERPVNSRGGFTSITRKEMVNLVSPV